jgi:hypothetical protein
MANKVSSTAAKKKSARLVTQWQEAKKMSVTKGQTYFS